MTLSLRAHRLASAAVAALSLAVATSARADHIGFPGVAGAAGPIVTVSADTLPAGKLAAAVRVTYARPKALSDTELAGRAARGIAADTTDYLVSPSVSRAYGATDDLTLSLTLPYVRRNRLREGVRGGTDAVEELGNPSGLGDATLLAQYRFAGDAESPWQAALLAGLKLPTGSTHERTPDGERPETEHQPGTGSWDPLLGLAVSRRLARVSVAANLLYQLSGPGVQSTRLGDRAQVNLGVAYRLGGEAPHPHERAHEHADAHGPAVDLVLELNGEWEGRQKVDGETQVETGGRVLYLSPGVRLSAPEGWAASLSLGIPIAQHIRLSHPDNDYRLTAGLARSF